MCWDGKPEARTGSRKIPHMPARTAGTMAACQTRGDGMEVRSRLPLSASDTDASDGGPSITHIADQIDAPTSGRSYGFDDPWALVFGKAI